MTKRLRLIPAFLTVWLFAFSLLSNCYCYPLASVPSEQPVAAHCEHHAGQAESTQKKQDCAPRYNTDYFEKAAVKIQPVLPEAHALPLQLIESPSVPDSRVYFEPKPFLASSPPIYILVRSLLI